jgi:hypothetical protein
MRSSWLVLGLIACGVEEPPGPCGGDPSLVLGREDPEFVPFVDGDPVPVDLDDDGSYRFLIDSRASGLDPSEAITAVVRLRFGQDPTQDFVGSIGLICTDAPASHTFVTPFRDEYQDADVLAGLHGSSFALDAVFTDVAGTVAEAHHTLVIDLP